MKKLLALLIVFTMIIGIMPVVSAAIPQNSGLGTALTFDKWASNSPSSGTFFKISSNEDDTFGTVYRYESTGYGEANSAGKGPYKAYKSYLQFQQDSNVTVTSGDLAFISFYYRINTSVDGTAYTTPTSIKVANKVAYNTNSGTDVDLTTDTWIYFSTVASVHSSPHSTTYLRQFITMNTSEYTDKICVDIADPKAVYMGAVTVGDGEATANEQVVSALSTTAITGITAGETAIDLTANPTSYTTTEQLTAENVTVATRYGSADKVVIETAESGESITIKVYAPYIDWRATGATPSATYTINMEKAEEPYAEVTENNGYGTGVILGTDTPTIVGSAGRKYNKLETITGTAAAPFDEYYSWTREAFTEEGTSNQSYLALSGDLAGGAKAGDWVYVSFYYRTYNRFTNSAGQVVDNNQIDLYPAIRSNKLDNPYYRTETAKHIRLTPDTTAESDVGEWKKLIYIQKLDYDTDEGWTLKLTSNHTKNSTDGTITGTNRKIDFADVKVVYFGLPEGNTTDDAVIKAAIEEAAGNYGLSKVYLNGEEIDTVSNPLSYSASAPRYTAREDVFAITGDSIHAPGLVYEYVNGFTHVIKSYPLDYDWLSGTDTRVESYTVNAVIEYDFYDFELDGLTLSLKGDNGLTAPKTGVIIGASYDANGKLLKLKAEPFSISGLGNALSVTIPESDETVAGMKVFIWDGIATSVPYVKTIRVDDYSTGKITQGEVAEEVAE